MKRWPAALGLACILAAGCSELKPNRCDQHSDCHPPTPKCDFSTKRCVADNGDAGGAGGEAGAGGMSGAAGQDAGVDKAPPSCVRDASGICTDKNKPFCDDQSGLCRACHEDMECRNLDPTKPVCETHDGSGVCVQCVGPSDCNSANPVCDPMARTCGPCTADSDCSLFAPNVCKTKFATAADAASPPGRCARPAETIYVGKTPAGTCSDNPASPDAGTGDGGVLAPPGSPSLPFCSMQPALGAIGPSRNVIVVTGSVAAGAWTYADQAKGPLLIVGQNKAKFISSIGPGFSMSSGNVTIRGITFTSQLTAGIEASGGTLTLEHVTVDQCMGGGILLDGASFDIENSTVSRNGTVMDGLVSWSGIYVKTVPASGPRKLNLVSITNNFNAGLQCAGKIDGTGVLASGNMGGVDVGNLCGFMPCVTSDGGASMTCGAQM